MRLLKFITEEHNIEDIITKLDGLSVPNRKPKAIPKVEWQIFKSMIDIVDSITQLKKSKSNESELKLKYFELKGKTSQLRIEIEDLLSALKKPDKTNKINKSDRTYIKSGKLSDDKFSEYIEEVEAFLSTLNGYHKKPLKKLVIRFVDGTKQKSSAKYKEKEDVLQINFNKIGKTKEEYGSLRYVILHELGHRFLKMFPQKWNYDDQKWITTKYSGVDSFSGEEKFAELFAISHWENKYKEYKEKIQKFKKWLYK